MIRIVTDTMSDIPQEVVNKYNIALIPAYVNFPDESFRDRFDLTSSEFYKRLVAADVLPTTGQPSVRDFEVLYRRLLAETPEATILSVHLSAALSGTIESGRQAANMLPEADIQIFDTRSLSLGEGLMVREAAHMAHEDAPLEAILKRLTDMRDNIQIYYTLDTLDYLVKGGRIGRAARLMGTLLDMKPILTLDKGAIEAHSRTRTRERAIGTLRDLALDAGRGKRGIHIGVMHSTCEEDARRLADELRAELEPDVLLITEIGPSIGTHVGPGTLGACWYIPSGRDL